MMAINDQEQERFSRSERFFSSTLLRYAGRVLILLTFSLIFQSFDNTFMNAAGSSVLRTFIFSSFYVLYGLLVWEGAVALAKTIEKKIVHKKATNRLAILCTVLLIYGLLAAYGFGFVYASTDIVFFNRYEAWESFARVSYDMNAGTFLFYTMILAFNGIIFYYKAWKEYQLQTERLKRENIQAKYDALRNQIDPHFFFNSLSVLTNLVYRSADLSADYITQLAKIYRYILDKKFENLVPIQTELDFLESYLFLIGIRHQNGVRFTMQLNDEVIGSSMVPPATLQMLIENAIKHNRFSANEPLEILLKHEDGFLCVENNVRKKLTTESSPGIGLENIRKRYELISGQPIEILETDTIFCVKLPVIE
jgi:two-component system, LytTR family, sensor kinase